MMMMMMGMFGRGVSLASNGAAIARGLGLQAAKAWAGVPRAGACALSLGNHAQGRRGGPVAAEPATTLPPLSCQCRAYSTISKQRPDLTPVGFLRSLRIRWQLYNLRKPWGFDPDEFIQGARMVWEQLHAIVRDGDMESLQSMKRSMTPLVYRELKHRAREREDESHHKLPAVLEDAHIINVFGNISSQEIRLSILVEFLARYTPTEDERDDFWDLQQWVFETPILTFRDEGYATDPVQELTWTLTSLNRPFTTKAPPSSRDSGRPFF
ncbi:hypothetical protein PTSG_01070 [Salpingoeca rosetta]|uniref:Tim44-like domain-containing protein n=1 Tax=Salpingoeca rosetta (strain ATCC 50818 / BSB-021) TaxID=946362 RepID=F2TYB1_SALR5|nr:uncharacterized protein PTSG_01070 [Salpingoeca rosetta]EGD76370.1 hypothetical protein PTSG_01070 [Salpingoeca rosetta]|eukprot:XP_004998545.1 hypothetical protein PTSG_01070 [Salpingoeca rosetta]